ncbi:uncharacterized protein LOC127566442 isoform X2 [Pristis pectinata]|uniref:uncharacterized protein LOC127566442 isoform X2 n=1 Tax=Pristis pectinata TaxID=685728 RepID=UPI00223CC4A5|nr:uncharacterized protein LOC127566442 isoform X2 [Pristis pectinata]
MTPTTVLFISLLALTKAILDSGDKPGAPLMSTGRSSPKFLESENVTIQCWSRPFYNGSVFYLRKRGDDSFGLSTVASGAASKVTFVIANAAANQSGDYECHYQIQRERATKPWISADRWNNLYFKAETPVVYCRNPQFTASVFYLYEGAGRPVLWGSATPIRNQGTFTITAANRSRDFTFSCAYGVKLAGRSVNSTTSDPMQVTVIDQPAKPTLRISPTHAHFSQYRTIVCSAVRRFRDQIFSLYKDGREVHVRSDLVSRRDLSVTYRIANTNKRNSGSYTCRYQVWASGRAYDSRESDSVELEIVDANLTLVDGPDQCSGRVEIHHRGQRGRIGNANWGLADAEVLCRHLGCGFGESIPSFGQGSERLWVNGATCQGTEKSFWDCYLQTNAYVMYWNKKTDASVKCSASPVKPKILLQRSPAIFVEGETFSIDCVAPLYYFHLTFYLGKVGGDEMFVTEPGFRVSFDIINATSTRGGSYRCWYQLKRDGRYYNSSVSETINVTVGDAAAKPIITQDLPQKVFLAGGSTILKCIAPYLTATTGFFIYRKGEEKALYSKIARAGKSMPFLVPVGTEAGSFYYTCAFQVHVSGRFFNSTPSDALEIIVTDQLSPPSLEIMKSIGTFEVNITISCLATNNFVGGMFYLYKEGQKGPVDWRRNTERWNRVRFSVSKANKTNGGNYTCQQQVTVNERQYNSSHSNQLKLTITDEITLSLVDGENECSGRVELFYNGELWRICAPRWRSSEINVVCRQMGCGFVASEAVSSYYGRGTRQVLPNEITCSGQETTLWQCSVTSNSRLGTCPRQRVAAVNCSARPEKPVILLSRPSGRFAEGENIKIHCRAASYFPGSSFYLFKIGEGREMANKTATKSSSQVGFNIVNASVEVSGSYACAYQAVRFGATYNSTMSLSTDVIVTEHYPKPTITANRQRDTFFVGDRLSVECVTPKYIGANQFYIQMHHNHVAEIIPFRLTGRGAMVTPENLAVGTRYNFTCMYQGRLRGRAVNSTWSDALQLTITDRLPKPRVSVVHQDPSRFQKQILIMCRSPETHRGRIFHLHKDGSADSIASRVVPATRSSMSFDIDNLNETNSGNYTCSYDIEWMGNTYSSEHSDPIEIQIRGVRLRLSHGETPCSGLVEVSYNQRWGPVCDRNWRGTANAEVICKQLHCGFSHPLRASWSRERRKDTAILTGVNCRGNESSLLQCSLSTSRYLQRCYHWQFATVNCTMKPVEPTIELQKRFATFMEGQNVSIECTARNYYAGSRFYLGKVGKPYSLSSWPTSRTKDSATFTLGNVSLSDAGSYTCLYEVERAGKMYNSTDSRSLSVQITDRPPTPVLSSLESKSTHLIGSQVVLYCNTPFTWFASEIGLYSVVGDDYLSVKNSTESSSRGTFTLDNQTTAGISNYSCRYSFQLQDHLLYSNFSDVLTITFTDQLPKPRLALEEAMLNYPVPIFAKCSVPISYFGGVFSLYKAGEENFTQTRKLFGHDRSTYFSFQVEEAVNYTCQYSVVTSRRVYKSPHSDPLWVPADGDVKVRLAGGTNACSGRVELHYAGRWRGVCSQYWGIEQVEVVCRQLGCGFAFSALHNASYGRGTEMFVTHEVWCTGFESSLHECRSRPFTRQRRQCAVCAECSDRPLAPQLTSYKWNTNFMRGENISMTCYTLAHYKNVTFHLRTVGSPENVATVRSEHKWSGATFRFNAVNGFHGGNYTCMYQLQQDGKTYNSSASRVLEVIVSDRAPKVRIRVSRPSSLFLEGEPMPFICTSIAQYPHSAFYLTIGPHLYVIYQSMPIATFTVNNIKATGVYNCTCKCSLMISGVLINSSESSTLQVTVTDELPTPQLSLLRRSYRLSDMLRMFCTSSLIVPGGRFSLFRNGERESSRSHVYYGWGRTATFVVARVTQNVANYYYTCQYSVKVLGRTFVSAYSRPLLVDTPDDSLTPVISLVRLSGSFVQGETVTMRCTTPRYYVGCKQVLRKLGDETDIVSTTDSNSTCNTTFELRNVTIEVGGHYACWLQLEMSSSVYNSTSVEVIVTDRPSKPYIELNRSPGLYIKGEHVFVDCAAPDYYAVSNFYLLVDGTVWLTYNEKEEIYGTGSFTLNTTSIPYSAICTCHYETKISDNYINSTVSDTVHVTVTDQLPKPLIWIEAPSTAFFPGETLRVKCAPPTNYPITSFSLYRNRSTVHTAEQQPFDGDYNVTFTLLHINESNEGNYTCRFQADIAGELYTSESSDQIPVMLSDQLHLRLDGGGSNCSGRVEIYYGKRWLTVCGSDWGLGAAEVVCRQLGCGFAEAVTYFEQVATSLWLNGTRCGGMEGFLWDCTSDAWGDKVCTRGEDAGVVCNADHSPKPQLTLTRRSKTFLQGENVTFTCRSPIQYPSMTIYLYRADRPYGHDLKVFTASNGTETFNIADLNGTDTGNYICVYELQVSGEIFTSAQSDPQAITVREEAEKPIIYGKSPFESILRGHTVDIGCDAPYELPDLTFNLYKDGVHVQSMVASNSATFSLRNISSQNSGNYTCTYQKEISGRWRNSTLSDPFEVFTSDFVSDDVNLRLANGSNPCSGRLEVLYNGAWGTVCEDGWSIANADVICRDLTCGFAELSTDSSIYGEGAGPIWLHDVRCDGTESSLWACSSQSHQAHRCTHSNDIGVSCTDYPPPPLISLNRPNGIFFPGEVVIIQCATHSHYTVTKFYLNSIDGDDVSSPQPSSCTGSTANFTAEVLSTTGRRQYSCHYSMSIDGTNLNSSLSEIVSVTVTYVPAKPGLYLLRPSGEPAEGESFSLRCTLPEHEPGLDVIRFHLYKLTDTPDLIGSHARSSNSFEDFTISDAALSDGGTYICMYEAQRSGRWYNSTYSDTVTVTVSARINRPTASLLRSSGIFTEGENIEITCSAPEHGVEVEFHLLKVGTDSSRAPVATETARRTAYFTISNVNVTEGGKYACIYEVEKDGMVYGSTPSSEVTVTVIDLLPRPSITRTPILPFVLEGESTTIRCIVPELYGETMCYLLKDNGPNPRRSELLGREEHSCSFAIESADIADGGNYTCLYEARVAWRTVHSRLSETLPLTVRAPLSKPNISISYRHQFQDYIINCTVPVLYPGSNIYLYKVVGGQYRQVTSARMSGVTATFLISNVSAAVEGNYTCYSETAAGGRLLKSSFSDVIAAPLEDSNPRPSVLALCLGGFTVALFVLLLAVLFCKKSWHCETSQDSSDLQAHLLSDWEAGVDVGDLVDRETLL